MLVTATGGRWRARSYGCVGALACALVACGPPPRAPQAATTVALPVSCDLPQTVHLSLETSDRLNPDALGRSLPTIVRVYQLKNIARLEQAEFADVWRHARETLADDIVGVEEVVMQPHQRVVRAFTRNPEAHYIVGVGIFRRPAGVAWWTPYELPPPPSQARCAAQRRNPSATPDVPDPRFGFFLEDYRIEAAGDDGSADDAAPDAGGASGGVNLPDAGVAPPEAPAVNPPAMPGLSRTDQSTQGNRAG